LIGFDLGHPRLIGINYGHSFSFSFFPDWLIDIWLDKSKQLDLIQAIQDQLNLVFFIHVLYLGE
jgi:hypothetical protein